jgi:hypothetical protein
MSEDGTGGVVFRRTVDGRPHIYAAQFTGGRWRAPQRVDVGQRFESAWPAIGAGDGGRLVVVWVQENGIDSDRMFSATIEPGARRFTAPVPVDMNVGEMTDTWPSVAMARGGQAYVVYRTVEDRQRTRGRLPRGLVVGEYRLARFNGQLWSPLGFPINRNSASPVAEPTRENAPRIGIDASGLGGRRVAGARRRPHRPHLGAARLRRVRRHPAARQPAAPRRPAAARAGRPARPRRVELRSGRRRLPPARRADRPAARHPALHRDDPESFVQEAAAFRPSRVTDGFGAEDPPAVPGPVSVATVAGAFATSFAIGVDSLLVGGTDKEVDRPERLDEGSSTVAGDPQVDLSPTGALVAAWRLRVRNRGEVGLSEQRADGVPERRRVFAARGGPVTTLDLAGSGLGDAIVAWRQGAEETSQIAAAVVNAPPGEFAVQTPADFVNDDGRYLLRWDPAPNAIGDVKYAVLVDDEEIAADLTRTRFELDLKKVDDGVTAVQVVARDEAGQDASSVAATFKLDRRAPTVGFEPRRGRRLRVVVRDGATGQVSGADHAATEITWGDRRTAQGREGSPAIVHTYRRPGSYRVTVRVRDVLGNARRVVRTVRVR